jgi:hypothetical protein
MLMPLLAGLSLPFILLGLLHVHRIMRIVIALVVFFIMLVLENTINFPSQFSTMVIIGLIISLMYE